MKTSTRKKVIILAFLGLLADWSGIVLLIVFAGWKIALGVGLMILGNNLSKRVQSITNPSDSEIFAQAVQEVMKERKV